MGQPAPKAAVLGCKVVHQDHVHGGFVDHDRGLLGAVVEQWECADLVGVEFTQGVGFEVTAYESAQIAGGEPDLGF